MDKNRPRFREKNVGSGGGEARGKSRDYSDQNGDRNHASGGSGCGGNRSAGGSLGCGTKLSPTVIIVVVIITAVLLISRNCSKADSSLGTATGSGKAIRCSPLEAPRQPGATQAQKVFWTQRFPRWRTKYTSVKGGGQDIVTVMIYLCGTDLEAKRGAATVDLQEMMNVPLSNKVNIIIETGGTSAW